MSEVQALPREPNKCEVTQLVECRDHNPNVAGSSAPQAQGAQVAQNFFHSGASQSGDIEQLFKMLPGKSAGVEAARQYAVSDLLEKTNTAGVLSAPKLNAWIDHRKPAIDKLFSEQQVGVLNNVRSDMVRQWDANALGRAAGSNTTQNLIGEGLLDSKVASLLSRLLPYVGPAGLDAVKSHQKRAAVEEIGSAMVNPELAIRALNMYEKLLNKNAAQRGLESSFPAVVPALSSSGAER